MKPLMRIRALTVRNIKEILRDPLSLIFLYATPILMLVLFYYLFSSQTDQFGLGFLAPSMCAFANAFLALFLGLLISLDRSSSFIIRLYTTETRGHEFMISYAAAMLPIGVSQSAVILLISGAVDASLFSARMLAGIAASLAVSFLYVSFGLLIGSLLGAKSVGGVASIVVMGQSILSGMWFPPEGLSSGFLKVMNALPFRSASELMRISLAGGESAVKPLITLLCWAIPLSVLAVVVYGRKMKQ
jgi:ABC-2 type transport system permease protein